MTRNLVAEAVFDSEEELGVFLKESPHIGTGGESLRAPFTHRAVHVALDVQPGDVLLRNPHTFAFEKWEGVPPELVALRQRMYDCRYADALREGADHLPESPETEAATNAYFEAFDALKPCRRIALVNPSGVVERIFDDEASGNKFLAEHPEIVLRRGEGQTHEAYSAMPSTKVGDVFP